MRDALSLLYTSRYDLVEPIARKTRRSLLRRPKKRADLLGRIKREVDLVAAGGVFLGKSAEFVVKAARFDSVMVKIAKGLHYHHTGQVIEGTDKISAHFQSKYVAPEILVVAQHVHEWGDEFSYRGATSPNTAIWWLNFYRSHLAIVTFVAGPLAAARNPGE